MLVVWKPSLAQKTRKPSLVKVFLYYSVSRKWQEEKAALLDEMDEKECTDQEEWMIQGKKELEEWYARLNEQLGKTKENNRYWYNNIYDYLPWKM